MFNQCNSSNIDDIIMFGSLYLTYKVINYVRHQIGLSELYIDNNLKSIAQNKFNSYCNETVYSLINNVSDVVSDIVYVGDNVSLVSNVSNVSLVGLIGAGVWYSQGVDYLENTNVNIKQFNQMFDNNLTHIGCYLNYCKSKSKHILVCAFGSSTVYSVSNVLFDDKLIALLKQYPDTVDLIDKL